MYNFQHLEMYSPLYLLSIPIDLSIKNDFLVMRYNYSNGLDNYIQVLKCINTYPLGKTIVKL